MIFDIAIGVTSGALTFGALVWLWTHLEARQHSSDSIAQGDDLYLAEMCRRAGSFHPTNISREGH